jgi:Arc/MetJ-type ribon-helix-helix transcriptional regulator
MSRAVPVRLDDDDIATLDELVRLGLAANRSDAIKRGIDRDRRRLAALKDAQVYRRDGEDAELATFASTAASTPLTDLD